MIVNPNVVSAFFFKASVVWAAFFKIIAKKKKITHTYTHSIVFNYSCPPSEAQLTFNKRTDMNVKEV